jgi:hypothetical protein
MVPVTFNSAVIMVPVTFNSAVYFWPAFAVPLAKRQYNVVGMSRGFWIAWTGASLASAVVSLWSGVFAYGLSESASPRYGLEYGIYAVVAAIPPAVWIVSLVLHLVARRKRDVRLRRGLCAHCGYDLRATSGRCPECGLEASEPRCRI